MQRRAAEIDFVQIQIRFNGFTPQRDLLHGYIAVQTVQAQIAAAPFRQFRDRLEGEYRRSLPCTCRQRER